MSAPRFYAALALFVLVAVAELAARRARRRALGNGAAPTTANWAWNAAGVVVVGARVGFVIENLGYFATRPLEALAFWQGGFGPWWGVAFGAALVAWTFRRNLGAIRTTLAPVALALAVWLVVPPLLTPAEASAVRPPRLELERLTGGVVDLEALAEGPLILNTWATWCLPCRREIPQLARAAAENPGATFLLVNQGEDPDAIRKFLADYPAVNLDDVLLDGGMEVAEHLGGVGLPTTYFFAAGGEHVATHVGEISGAALEQMVRRLVLD